MSGCLILPRWRRYDARGKIRLTVVAGITVVTTVGLGAFAGRSWGGVLVQPTYTPYWVHTDNLGSPIAMTNASGSVVWQTWYAPFGETADLNDDPGNTGTHVTMNIRRPGQYFDQETGLYYNWRRFYDPVAGRYLQADPLSNDDGSLRAFRVVRPYQYVGNQPLNKVDLTGRGHCLDACFHRCDGAWFTSMEGCCKDPGSGQCHLERDRWICEAYCDTHRGVCDTMCGVMCTLVEILGDMADPLHSTGGE
jgi:RHS repeat-associated protein